MSGDVVFVFIEIVLFCKRIRERSNKMYIARRTRCFLRLKTCRYGNNNNSSKNCRKMKTLLVVPVKCCCVCSPKQHQLQQLHHHHHLHHQRDKEKRDSSSSSSSSGRAWRRSCATTSRGAHEIGRGGGADDDKESAQASIVLPQYRPLGSFVQIGNDNDNDGSDLRQSRIDSNCSSSSSSSKCAIALGKFEALHMGHQQLAYRLIKSIEENNNNNNNNEKDISQLSSHKLRGAFLVRLRGVSAALRHKQKIGSDTTQVVQGGDNDGGSMSSGNRQALPLVAPVDRARVLHEWSRIVADPAMQPSMSRSSEFASAVHECSLSFNSVRQLSPETFVNEILHKQLGVGLVAVGPDFRFGYKARGDVEVRITHMYIVWRVVLITT